MTSLDKRCRCARWYRVRFVYVLGASVGVYSILNVGVWRTEGVVKYHKDYERIVTEHGICQQDIYNIDETGYQIGVGRDRFIITRHPKKKLFNGSVTNWESITVLEAVSADGFACSPLIVLSAKQELLRRFDAIEGDGHLAITGTGYINNTSAYQWI